MLARTNRIVRADDYRMTVRRGRRVATPHLLLYVVQGEATRPARFGFIVSKAVGNSVARNLVTRRLRAIGREAVTERPQGRDVIVRALPGSFEASWVTLRTEILEGLEQSAQPRTVRER